MDDQNTVNYIWKELVPPALGGALGIMHVAQKKGTTLKDEAALILPKETVEILFRPAQRKRQIANLLDIVTIAFAAVIELKALER